MDNLVFSLNATMPVFFTMALGYVFHLAGFIDEAFANRINSFVFRIALPVLLFRQLATTDFISVWDGKLVLFCFLSTAAGIAVCILAAKFLVEPSSRGEFIQAAYRASQALLATAYVSNMYEHSETVALMIIGSVPLYNIMAVTVLILFPAAPADTAGKKGGAGTAASGETAAVGRLTPRLVKNTLVGIVTNPIIISILIGLAWSVLRLPYGTVFGKTVANVGQLATPLGLLGMGASLDPKKVSGAMKPALIASFIKLAGLPALTVPAAVLLGFRNEALATILVMTAAPTTVSSYIMARNFGHDGTLTSNTVVITTLASGFTLTLWIWLLRSRGLI